MGSADASFWYRTHVILAILSLCVLRGTMGIASEDDARTEGRRLVDISDSPCCRELELTDQDGVATSLRDYLGKTVIVVFGFTHCPIVCPTTLLELSSGLEDKPYKSDVALLFVTLDPDRDGAAMLKEYVTAFPPAVALRGGEQETKKTAVEFRVLFHEIPDKVTEEYTLEHTTGSYVIDNKGSPAWYVPYGGINGYFWDEIGKMTATR